MRDTAGTIAYLRDQAQSGSASWYQLCQKLARVARDLPAVYPSALAAQEATPKEDRVYDLADVRRGMVAFFDDPSDSNPYGHITTVSGRNEGGELLHWSNDAKGRGTVALVRHSFFERNWGDHFQFAATSLNGFDLTLPRVRTPGPAIRGSAPAIEDAIGRIEAATKRLDSAIRSHREKGHDRLVDALKRDRTEMRETVKRLRATIEKFS